MSAFYPYASPHLSKKQAILQKKMSVKHSHKQLYTCIKS
jgi:hypothetical protein